MKPSWAQITNYKYYSSGMRNPERRQKIIKEMKSVSPSGVKRRVKNVHRHVNPEKMGGGSRGYNEREFGHYRGEKKGAYNTMPNMVGRTKQHLEIHNVGTYGRAPKPYNKQVCFKPGKFIGITGHSGGQGYSYYARGGAKKKVYNHTAPGGTRITTKIGKRRIDSVTRKKIPLLNGRTYNYVSRHRIIRGKDGRVRSSGFM